jgi:hypothetical protein
MVLIQNSPTWIGRNDPASIGRNSPASVYAYSIIYVTKKQK